MPEEIDNVNVVDKISLVQIMSEVAEIISEYNEEIINNNEELMQEVPIKSCCSSGLSVQDTQV